MDGVADAAVGYAGGATANPTYEQVCTDRTGHAEVVQVTFDPSQVSYDELLEAFWNCHDPTQGNRQGPNVGGQYRSAIFTQTPEQRKSAEAAKTRLDASGRFRRPISTEIAPARTFWRAEEYHQRYYEKHGYVACRVR